MRKNRYIDGLNYELPHPFRSESDRLNEQFEKDAFVDEKGIVRWETNRSIPPKDILEYWNYLKKPFEYELSCKVSDRETEKFLEDYKESHRNYVPSEEELFEMKAAFGTRTTVVDVVTGQKQNYKKLIGEN